MTNREWFETLSDEMLANEISERCGLCANQDVVDCGDCVSGITTWLTQEYEPPKKEFTQDQLNKVFRDKFVERRAIGISEIEKLIGELFR